MPAQPVAALLERVEQQVAEQALPFVSAAESVVVAVRSVQAQAVV